jgi:hypothetical protein
MAAPIRIPVVSGSLNLDLDRITGGLQPAQILDAVDRGARFVVYQYSISAIIITFRRNSAVQFVKAGESAVTKGIPYILISLVLGWWGFPWGFIFTPQAIYRDLKGGTDVTSVVLTYLPAS